MTMKGEFVMALILLDAPPVPYYIMGGHLTYPAGSKHPNRRSIGLFDLLVVKTGCLYITENGISYDVNADHALILLPDGDHYATKGCEEPTEYYWIHFNASGSWSVQAGEIQEEPLPSPSCPRHGFAVQNFTISLPHHTALHQPASLYEDLDRLTQLEVHAHLSSVSWEQQQLFQRVLRQLSLSGDTSALSPSRICAQKAASYLRANYRNDIKAQEMGERLNFHPVYIARCMQREFGCSPFEYLTRFRIEQAKLLMDHTDLPIARIAEEVGFKQASYFSTCFHKYEGAAPRSYRNRFL